MTSTWTRRYLGAVGAATILGAFLALSCPMRLDAADHRGQPLTCGSVLHPSDAAVSAEDELNALRHDQDRDLYQRSDYSGECRAWITEKRWAGLATASGGAVTIVVVELLLHPRRRRWQGIAAPPDGQDHGIEGALGLVATSPPPLAPHRLPHPPTGRHARTQQPA